MLYGNSFLIVKGQYWNMQKAGGYYITIIEDTRTNTIIGSASLITEFKFIHGCGLRARLEDVVVNNTYRGKQLGKLYDNILKYLSVNIMLHNML